MKPRQLTAALFPLLRRVVDEDGLDISDEEIREGHHRIEWYEWIAREAYALATPEVERLTEHSKTLNAVAFKLAAALGDIPHGQQWTEGNPVELAERLIAERDAARFERDNMRVTIRQAFGAGDDAWTVVANSPYV